jgi:hypothetical protein
MKQALAGQEHWLREQVEACKAKPSSPQRKHPPKKQRQKRVRPGPKTLHKWDVLDALFEEDPQALALVLRERYRQRANGLDISERSLNEARQRFIKAGKSEPE